MKRETELKKFFDEQIQPQLDRLDRQIDANAEFSEASLLALNKRISELELTIIFGVPDTKTNGINEELQLMKEMERDKKGFSKNNPTGGTDTVYDHGIEKEMTK